MSFLDYDGHETVMVNWWDGRPRECEIMSVSSGKIVVRTPNGGVLEITNKKGVFPSKSSKKQKEISDGV